MCKIMSLGISTSGLSESNSPHSFSLTRYCWIAPRSECIPLFSTSNVWEFPFPHLRVPNNCVLLGYLGRRVNAIMLQVLGLKFAIAFFFSSLFLLRRWCSLKKSSFSPSKTSWSYKQSPRGGCLTEGGKQPLWWYCVCGCCWHLPKCSCKIIELL